MFSRILTPVLFMAILGACYSWRPESTSPDPSLGPTDSPIYVTLMDGRGVELALPTIADDTLRARDRRALRNGRAVPVTVPVSEIRGIDPAIRLTLTDGRSVELALPTIADDTLRAWDRRALRNGRAVPVTVPVSEIRAIEARRFSASNTIALMLGVPVGLGVAALVAISMAIGDTCWLPGCLGS